MTTNVELAYQIERYCHAHTASHINFRLSSHSYYDLDNTCRKGLTLICHHRIDGVSSFTHPSSSALNRIAAPIVDTFVGWYCLKGRVERKICKGWVYIMLVLFTIACIARDQERNRIRAPSRTAWRACSSLQVSRPLSLA